NQANDRLRPSASRKRRRIHKRMEGRIRSKSYEPEARNCGVRCDAFDPLTQFREPPLLFRRNSKDIFIEKTLLRESAEEWALTRIGGMHARRKCAPQNCGPRIGEKALDRNVLHGRRDKQRQQ